MRCIVVQKSVIWREDGSGCWVEEEEYIEEEKVEEEKWSSGPADTSGRNG